MKDIYKNLILLIFSMIISIFIIEIISRLYLYKTLSYSFNQNIYQDDKDLGWKYLPGQFKVTRVNNNINININSDGFRDKEFKYTKDEKININVYRRLSNFCKSS